METAREERSAEEPGRLGGVPEHKPHSGQRPGGIHNLGSGPDRESERLIVAGKRVTTVERRGLTRK